MPRLLLMNNGLDGTWNNLRIEVRTGTKNVELDGDCVVGEWKDKAKILAAWSVRPVALKLMNASFADEAQLAKTALLFTREFGPLKLPFEPGAPFRLPIRDWQAQRRLFVFAWKIFSDQRKRKLPIDLPIGSGDHFSFASGQLSFHTGTLWTFMALEIGSVSGKRLRRCANFMYGCGSPYFIASDFREKYCSPVCADERRKQGKLRWWNENRKGKESGTEKAR